MLYLYDVDDIALDSEFHADALADLTFRIDDQMVMFAKATAADPTLLKALDLHFGGVSVIIGDFAGPLSAAAMSLPLPTVADDVALRLFHEQRDVKQQEMAFELLKEDGYISSAGDSADVEGDDSVES